MKIRINKTGEILNATHVIELGVGIYRIDTKRDNGVWSCTLNEEEFVFIADPDWDSLKIQTSIALLQSILANPNFTDKIEKESKESESREMPSDIASDYAILYADKIISKLKDKHE